MGVMGSTKILPNGASLTVLARSKVVLLLFEKIIGPYPAPLAITKVSPNNCFSLSAKSIAANFCQFNLCALLFRCVDPQNGERETAASQNGDCIVGVVDAPPPYEAPPPYPGL